MSQPTNNLDSNDVGKRETMDVIKVRAVSRTAAVAGAIAGIFRDEKHAEVQAIGAGACLLYTSPSPRDRS